MDDFGNDSNMLKLILGLIIGLIVIMIVIPLAANIMATQSVNNAVSDVELYGDDLPSTATGIVQTESINSNSQSPQTNSENSVSDKAIIGSDDGYDLDGIMIISGSITTGSSLSSKSECMVYVGSQYAGSKVQIATLYSRDGNNLNQGKFVTKTIDQEGYITVKSASSFELYPDECLIEIYDMNDNILASRFVQLEATSGTQYF